MFKYALLNARQGHAQLPNMADVRNVIQTIRNLNSLVPAWF